MLTTIVWAVLGTATAQDLVPVYEGEPRSWKLEAYGMSADRFASANHLPAAYETWGAHVTCTPVGKRRESCAFEGDVLWYGFSADADAEPSLHEVAAPVTIEVRWTPTGRVASWDMQGDPDAFRQALAKAYNHRVPTGWQFDSTNFRRRLGQELEQRVVMYLLAPLEVDLPRKGDAKGMPWRSQTLPYAMRRTQGGLGGTKVELSVVSQDEQATLVSAQGETTSTVLSSTDAVLPASASSEQTFNTKMTANLLVGRADGRVLASEVWTSTWSTLPVIGFKIHVFRATRWADDLTPEPGVAPKPPWL